MGILNVRLCFLLDWRSFQSPSFRALCPLSPLGTASDTAMLNLLGMLNGSHGSEDSVSFSCSFLTVGAENVLCLSSPEHDGYVRRDDPDSNRELSDF